MVRHLPIIMPWDIILEDRGRDPEILLYLSCDLKLLRWRVLLKGVQRKHPPGSGKRYHSVPNMLASHHALNHDQCHNASYCRWIHNSMLSDGSHFALLKSLPSQILCASGTPSFPTHTGAWTACYAYARP